MIDVVYLTGTMLFFYLMLWYARVCAELGRDQAAVPPNGERAA